MKKFSFLSIVAVALIVTFNANAQWGVKAGYVNSSTKFSVSASSSSAKVTMNTGGQSGFFAGVDYDLALFKGLSLRPGVTYTYSGGESIYMKMMSAFDAADELPLGGLKMSDRDHSLSVPVDVKYAYSVTDRFKVYAFAGPRLFFGLSSTVSVSGQGGSGTINMYSGKVTMSGGGETETYKSDEGGYSRFDVLLGGGAGVQFNRLSLELGYAHGIMNRFDAKWVDNAASEGVSAKLKKGQFSVGVGYAF